MAQIAYNTKLSESTGTTPFFANHGQHPNLFTRSLDSAIDSDSATSLIKTIKKVHSALAEPLSKTQERTSSYTNKRRKQGPVLRKGDKVYLCTKSPRTRRPTKKLDHVKVGRFFVSEQVSLVLYSTYHYWNQLTSRLQSRGISTIKYRRKQSGK